MRLRFFKKLPDKKKESKFKFGEALYSNREVVEEPKKGCPKPHEHHKGDMRHHDHKLEYSETAFEQLKAELGKAFPHYNITLTGLPYTNYQRLKSEHVEESKEHFITHVAVFERLTSTKGTASIDTLLTEVLGMPRYGEAFKYSQELSENVDLD